MYLFIYSFIYLIILIACKDTTAISAGNVLIQWICRYGIPSQIVSDNGTQYANELIKTICTMFNIDQHLIQAYSHEENAIVERANKEVGRHLTAIVQDRKVIDQWSPMIPLIQQIMNSQVHQSIGISPLQLLFGNAIDVDRMLLTNNEAFANREEINRINDTRYREWADTMLDRQQTLIEVAMKNQYDTDIFHSEHANKNKQETTEFPINSYVLQTYEQDNQRPPSKLNTRLRGPHKVVAKHSRVDGPDVYTVQNLASNKLEDFKITDLRTFNFDEQRVNPQEVAIQDKQLYIVESVLEHKGTGAKRSLMQFHIKWKGYDETSWEPWSNVKDNIILHNYLKANKLQRLIPKQFTMSIGF